MMFWDRIIRAGVAKMGWDFFPADVREELIELFLDMAVLDVARHVENFVHETVTPKDVLGMVKADHNIVAQLKRRYGEQFTLNQVVDFLENAPVLREYVIALANNKMNRVISYLSWKEEYDGLNEEETTMLSVLLEKFGGPLGTPTPEMFLERCKKESEELLIINKDKVNADENEE